MVSSSKGSISPLVFLFLFLQLSLGIAQEAVNPLLPNLHFDHLTISDRLSHNTVYCMVQDHYGYMWIGTQNGLNKYDGYSFKIYRSDAGRNAEEGFKGKIISALYEDSNNNLWVGTRKQGINLRPSGQDTFLNLSNHPAFSHIRDYEISTFYEDMKGRMWVGTVGRGLLCYDPASNSSRWFNRGNSKLSSDFVFSVMEDEDQTLWVLTAGVGIYYLDPDENFQWLRNEQYGMPGYRKCMLQDGDQIWMGTEGSGLYVLDTKNKKYRLFAGEQYSRKLGSNAVMDLHLEGDQLFIATDGGGLSIYDKNQDKLYTYTYQQDDPSSLNSNALLNFCQDQSGSLWIGTFNGGLNVYKPHKLRFDFLLPPPAKNTGLINRSVLSILQDSKGFIWVGTDGGGLYTLDPKTREFLPQSYRHDPDDPASLSGNVVKTLFEDSRGYMWVGNFATGLNRFDPKKGTFKRFTHDPNNPNSLALDNVWSIDEDEAGHLWIGTTGGGVDRLDLDSFEFTHFRPVEGNPNSLGDINVMAVFVDRQNRIWLGTADKGLDLWIEESQSFRHFRHDAEDSLSLSNDEVRAIFQDSRGEIWIGTEGGGLNRWLGDGKFEHIDESQGLIANSVMGITEDEEGMLWISTFEGISRLDMASGEIRNFDFHGSRKSNQFNQLSILSSRSGGIYFGGINGLNFIHPSNVLEIQQPQDLLFTGLQVFNKEIRAGKEEGENPIIHQPIEQKPKISLSHTDDSFTLFFTSTDYTHPLENTFTYKLEGFDTHWQKTRPGQHSVSYTNLDPGEYVFQLKNEEARSSIAIVVAPPFWKQTWFRVLFALLSLGLISGILVFMLNRREALYRRKMLQAEQRILKLKNEKLAYEVNTKNSKLMSSAIQMAHKNEILTDIREDIKILGKPGSPEMKKIIAKLNRELENEDYWKQFTLYFNQVDKDFVRTLQEKHPDLTQNDLRLCTLIRTNLTNKEIASLLNISVRGVEQGRYRLKKRLGLGSEESLSRYISNFGS